MNNKSITMPKRLEIKRNKYKSARGGYSRFLNLHCRKCNNIIAVYQKDGPGNLRRLYLDRIISPEKITGLQKNNIKDLKPLKCEKCGFIVGMPYIYEKEKRKAFRLFQDAIVKSLRKKIIPIKS
jgi:hypothetical protein